MANQVSTPPTEKRKTPPPAQPPQPALPPPTPPPAEPTDEAAAGGGLTLRRVVMIASGGLIALILLIFVLALVVARGNVEQWGAIIEIVRDLVIIFLALEGILIILALSVLILQVARLINLLQNEVQPILKNTQETIKSAKGTVDFVSETVTGPIVRATAFVAGVNVVVNNAFGLRRMLKRTGKPKDVVKKDGEKKDDGKNAGTG
jgi:hypothetical protein